jgi:hypothetical protein
MIGSNIDAIWWHGDAIMFDVGATKTDPEGTWNIDHHWHIMRTRMVMQSCLILVRPMLGK